MIDAFVSKFNCSKHDGTAVIDSQPTVCSSNVLKMGATQYSIVTDCNYESFCWVDYWTSSATCVIFWWSNQKKSRRGMFANGNGNWCMLGRAFLCRTGHFCRTMYFCVELGIFVSNRAFLCRPSVTMLIEHRSKAKVSDQCLIDISSRVFAIWDIMIFT